MAAGGVRGTTEHVLPLIVGGVWFTTVKPASSAVEGVCGLLSVRRGTYEVQSVIEFIDQLLCPGIAEAQSTVTKLKRYSTVYRDF